jgi:4-hydroxy-tetrahydrodipicolinate synthase
MITKEQAKARWHGVVIPVVTPFHEDRSLDLRGLRANIRWLIEKGARVGNTILLAAGSGGDFTTMTVDERKQVIEVIAEEAAGVVPVIAGAQSTDIRDAISLARFCAAHDVDALQISGPYYYDGRPDDVIAWIEEIASAADVGLAIYNNWYTGYDMPMWLIERLIQMPQSVGVKWSSPSQQRYFQGVRRFKHEVAVIDNTLQAVPGYVAGCCAFVSHIGNYAPEFCWRVCDLLSQDRLHEATELFESVMDIYEQLIDKITPETAGEAIFVRPAMTLRGLTGGFSRPPSRDSVITEPLRDAFSQFLSLAALTQEPQIA